MKITRQIARKLALIDDATEYGGKAHCDEKLDEFMESVGIPFGSSLTKVNKGLVECGIEPFTKEQILKAINGFSKEEINLLNTIARHSKMDCWFCIDAMGRVYDLEKGSQPIDTWTGIKWLIEGMSDWDFSLLSDKDKVTLIKLLVGVERRKL